jgi:hypothetical protein
MKHLGIGILIIGLVVSLITGLTFVTREKVIDIGGVQIVGKQEHRLAWSPIIGVVIMVVGAGICYSKRKSSF